MENFWRECDLLPYEDSEIVKSISHVSLAGVVLSDTCA